MKTPSRTSTYVALAVVAMVAVLGIRAFAMASTQEKGKHYKFHKQIGGPGPNDYAELKKTQQDLDAALNTLKDVHGGAYHLKFLCKSRETPIDPYNHHSHPPCHIRPAKVTKYERGNIAATDSSAANDPNAVQHLYSDYEADIDAVVACFKP